MAESELFHAGCDGHDRPSTAAPQATYATFRFNTAANLDIGAMWPVAFALKALSAADEAWIRALVIKAVG